MLRRSALRQSLVRCPSWITVMASPFDRSYKPAQTVASLADYPSSLLNRKQSTFDCAITFWRGTSGHAYVHSIYALAGCPEVPPACVLLVRRKESDGSRRVVKVMSVENEAPSLNLAEIRQFGAQLGATEVHLHFATGNRLARRTATFDLATRHGGIAIVGK